MPHLRTVLFYQPAVMVAPDADYVARLKHPRRFTRSQRSAKVVPEVEDRLDPLRVDIGQDGGQSV